MQKNLKNRGKTAYFTGYFAYSLVDRIYIIGCNLGDEKIRFTKLRNALNLHGNDCAPGIILPFPAVLR